MEQATARLATTAFIHIEGHTILLAREEVGNEQPNIELDALIASVRKYLPDADLEIVRRAYRFAEKAHATQVRQSGEPFITHPLAVALILAEFHLDIVAITAALLHDVVEDTGVEQNDLVAAFGPEVAGLVAGVTKLSRLDWEVLEEGKRLIAKPSEEDLNIWAENLRKMLLAMAEDVRVVLIKLADRLHNMRTLIHLPPHKRRRIARETMEIYAPLANRLGVWQIKWQLEDLAFRHLEPEKYREIATMLASRRVAREKYVAHVVETLQQELVRSGLKAEVNGRPKHINSIYRKMQRRGVGFDQVYDLLAVRVIVDSIPDCYSALGIVHAMWHPLPGQFDDYISMPKESLYQSLHTTVLGPEGRPLEIQIRTNEMHRLAEYGVAAHWRYKEGGKRDVKFEEKIAWLRQLVEWQKEVTGGAQEFVESLKADIFQDQVYVFTPKGEIKDLPAGATPVDFAYRIHTDVGHRCVGSKIGGRLVPLDYHLRNGDIVEIITAKAPKGPSRDWLNPNLNYVNTAHAREKIRQWFRKQQRDDNIVRGREALDKELRRLGLLDQKLEDLAKLFKFDKTEDFLAAIGCGDIHPSQIALKMATEREEVSAGPALPEVAPAKATSTTAAITVMGVGDLLTRLAHCCKPVPGDEIVGYITRGKGVTVHRLQCGNVRPEADGERLVTVEWGRAAQSTYPVNIRVEAWDRDGLLRDIATIVAEDKINMTAVSAVVHSDRTATIRATLEVAGLDKLSRILSKIEGLRDVATVARDLG